MRPTVSPWPTSFGGLGWELRSAKVSVEDDAQEPSIPRDFYICPSSTASAYSANAGCGLVFDPVPGNRQRGCVVALGPENLHHGSGQENQRAGGSLRDIQELAGHASLGTMQRYIAGDTAAKRNVIALI
jgi:hypothetical protein